MEHPDGSEQEASLRLYKSQLSQVDQAIQAAGCSDDLLKLKSDLEELIKLTEDNLLEIKKANLLRILGPCEEEEEEAVDKTTTEDTRDIDDEYAAFQSAIAESSNTSCGESSTNKVPDTSGSFQSSHNTHTTTGKSYTDKHEEIDDIEEDHSFEKARDGLLELVGTKCRAPFSQDWGDLHYGNALILSVDPPEDAEHLEDCVVHVIFINPTHTSMVSCKYFMEGKCRFSEQDCRASHGHPVTVSQLHPYLEPDHSKIKEGCRCLAKPCDDDVWYKGLVVEICNDHQLRVHFEATKDDDLVLVENVIPLDTDESDDDNSDSDSEANSTEDSYSHKKLDNLGDDSDEQESELPVYLWNPLQTTEKLGAWETHTKGIGSKLMVKMGYIPGQGLGRHGDGRAEPVPILLLPPGKSLDKIMQLKEMAGNEDLFNAMKKMEKRQKIMEKIEAGKEKQQTRQANWDVFGFLNNHLGKSKGEGRHNTQSTASSSSSLSSSKSSSPAVTQAKHSNEKDLTKRSDKEVNVQIFKTAEAIRGVERNLANLKQQLARNESKDRKMTENIRQKIATQENDLRKLKSSSQTLESHKERRKAHKKLTIF